MLRRTGLAKPVAWVWTFLIVLACWIPGPSLPMDESQGLQFRIPNLDKLIHVTMFAGFGYFWMQFGHPTRRRALMVLGTGLVLAIVTELGQGTAFVQRDASLADGLADLAGLSLAIGGSLCLSPRPRRPDCVSQNQHDK